MKPERGFEIQQHLEEHALHWKVGESPKVRAFAFQTKRLLAAVGCQVKSLSLENQEAYDKFYEDLEVQVLKDSRIVITTCTTAAELKLCHLMTVVVPTHSKFLSLRMGGLGFWSCCACNIKVVRQGPTLKLSPCVQGLSPHGSGAGRTASRAAPGELR